MAFHDRGAHGPLYAGMRWVSTLKAYEQRSKGSVQPASRQARRGKKYFVKEVGWGGWAAGFDSLDDAKGLAACVFEDVAGFSFEESAVGSDPDDSCESEEGSESESESESDELDELDDSEEVEDEELEDSSSSSDSSTGTGSLRFFCSP